MKMVSDCAGCIHNVGMECEALTRAEKGCRFRQTPKELRESENGALKILAEIDPEYVNYVAETYWNGINRVERMKEKNNAKQA